MIDVQELIEYSNQLEGIGGTIVKKIDKLLLISILGELKKLNSKLESSDGDVESFLKNLKNDTLKQILVSEKKIDEKDLTKDNKDSLIEKITKE